MLRVWLSMMLWMLCAQVVADAGAVPESVLVLGDSLSAGYGISVDESWPHLLQARLRKEGYKHLVVNASISGETTSGGARRITGLLDAHQPRVVLIALGANDGLRGFDPAETRRNVAKMITAARRAGAQIVLARVRIPPNYGPRYTASFEAVFDDLGAAEDVIYAPFLLERFALNPAAFQSDGLHPRADRQADILATMWPSLERALTNDAAISFGVGAVQ